MPHPQFTAPGQRIFSGTAGTGSIVALGHCYRFSVAIHIDGSPSAGQMIIEGSDSNTYTGTWATVDSSLFSDGNWIRSYNEEYPFIRARAGTTFNAGTVSVYAQGYA